MSTQPARKDRFEDYVPVSERIEQFYAKFPEGRILTAIVEHDTQTGCILMRAEAYRNPDDTQPAATGHAFESKDSGYVQKTSYVEVAECVPTDTEILTRLGWQKFDKLEIGQDVLAYDLQTDSARWTPLERVMVYENAELIRLFNQKGFEVFCTPLHSWAVTYKGSPTHQYWKLKTARELTNADRIVTACPAPHGSNLDVTIEQASLMGWVICDGHFTRPSPKQLRVGLGQSKPHTVKILLELMKGFGASHYVAAPYSRTFPSGKTYNCLEAHKWQLHAEEVRKLFAAFGIDHESELPQVVSQLTGPCRQAMLKAMMLADGQSNGVFGKKVRPWVMDVFSLLCALEGRAVLKRRYSSVGEVPLQMMKKSRFVYCSQLQEEKVSNAWVWCPTTTYGTWYARFANGVTTITGNTSAVGRALMLLNFETKRGLVGREDVQKRPHAAPPTREPSPEEEEHDKLDQSIRQAFVQKGHNITELRPMINKRYEVEDGLNSLSLPHKRDLLAKLKTS